MCGSLSALDEFELCPPSYTFVQAGPRGRSRCPSLHDEYDRNLSFRPASSRLRGVRRIRDKPNTTGASWRGVRFRSARGPSPLWRSVAAWPPAWRPRGEPDGPPIAEESGNCRAQPLPGGWRRCCGSVDREGGGDSCVGAPGGRVHEPYKGWREAMTANLPDSSVQRAHWPPLAPHVNRGCACAQEQDGAGPCRHLWLPAGVLRACLRQALGSTPRASRLRAHTAAQQPALRKRRAGRQPPPRACAATCHPTSCTAGKLCAPATFERRAPCCQRLPPTQLGLSGAALTRSGARSTRVTACAWRGGPRVTTSTSATARCPTACGCRFTTPRHTSTQQTRAGAWAPARGRRGASLGIHAQGLAAFQAHAGGGKPPVARPLPASTERPAMQRMQQA